MTLWSQSTSSLINQLKKATNKTQKLDLNYRIAEAYLKTDFKKAGTYAATAQSLAADLNNNTMLAKSAYVGGEAYYKQRQYGTSASRFNQSLGFAKKSGNNSLVAANYQRLIAIAKRKSNERGAVKLGEDAIAYFAKTKGTPSTSTPTPAPTKPAANNSVDQARLDKLFKDNVQMKKSINQLEKELNEARSTVAQSKPDDNLSAKEKAKFEEQKKKFEEQLEERDKAYKEIEEQKDTYARRNKRSEKELASMSKEALATEFELQQQEMEIQQANNQRNILGLSALFILGLAGLLFARFRSKKKSNLALEAKNKMIEEERERSDELLLNILPADIAKELKENGKASAKKYENVTVMFSDFKNFTQISNRLTPEQLVKELDYCFKGFDYIISQYKGIEKIKTIGDAYMCASGLSSSSTFPTDIIKAALDIQEFLEDYKRGKRILGEEFFEARIGVHTGPVVAGVVGVNKFAYDIWGETVNIASRMESQCEVGQVNISEATYNKIKYDFQTEYRGKLNAKNVGAMDMYYVKHPASAPANQY